MSKIHSSAIRVTREVGRYLTREVGRYWIGWEILLVSIFKYVSGGRLCKGLSVKLGIDKLVKDEGR